MAVPLLACRSTYDARGRRRRGGACRRRTTSPTRWRAAPPARPRGAACRGGTTPRVRSGRRRAGPSSRCSLPSSSRHSRTPSPVISEAMTEAFPQREFRHAIIIVRAAANSTQADRRIGAAHRRGGRRAALGRPPRATRGTATRRRRADHDHGGHAERRRPRRPHRGARQLPRRRRVTNGFDPHEILRDFDWGKTTRLPNGRTLREWELVAGDQEIEVAPGVKFAGLDLQQPHPRPDAARPRGRPHADHLPERIRASAHDPLARPPPGGPGRRARHRRRPDPAGRQGRLRVRRRAVRPAPLPLPRPPAGRAHRQGHVRRADHRPEGAAPRRRRARDGDERVRHQLRPGQRGLRRQHRRLRVHGQAGRGQARRADADLPGERARVRPDQLVPRPRELLRLLPDRDVEDADRADRHGHAVPGPARHPRAEVPARRAVHVPRAPVRVHRARLAGLLRGRATDGGRDRRTPRRARCRRGCSG